MLSSDFRASLWTMKIATYNVNGVNGRLPVLLRWLKQARPDVVCLQELKAPQEKFPEQARKMHYGEIEHRSIYGEASPDQAKELHEEGIEFHPLPVLPDERN